MTEYFDVVDENDEVIGKATREECHSDKSKVHRGIAIFVFNSNGKLFVQKRSMNKDLYKGLLTSSCSGHVDFSEDYKESALRELKEELGIDVKDDELKEILKTRINRERESEISKLYMIKYDGEINFNKEEIDSMDLMSIEEIKNKIDNNPEQFSQAFIILFNKYLETLKK